MERNEDSQFGNKLAKILKEQNLLQKDFAEIIKMDPTALSRVLAGERMPSADMVARMATALHVTSDYLLGVEIEDNDKFNVYEEMRVLSRNLHKISKEEKRQLVELLFEN